MKTLPYDNRFPFGRHPLGRTRFPGPVVDTACPQKGYEIISKDECLTCEHYDVLNRVEPCKIQQRKIKEKWGVDVSDGKTYSKNKLRFQNEQEGPKK